MNFEYFNVQPLNVIYLFIKGNFKWPLIKAFYLKNKEPLLSILEPEGKRPFFSCILNL